MAREIDWNAIKTEYVTTHITQRDLGKKYGVSAQAIASRSGKEGWVEQREQHFNKALAEAEQKIAEQQGLQLSDLVFGFDCLAGTILEIAKDKMQTGNWKDAKDAMSTLQSLIPMFKELHNIKDENDNSNIVITFKNEGDDYYG